MSKYCAKCQFLETECICSNELRDFEYAFSFHHLASVSLYGYKLHNGKFQIGEKNSSVNLPHIPLQVELPNGIIFTLEHLVISDVPDEFDRFHFNAEYM